MVCVQLLHCSLPFIYQMTMCRYCLLVLWISMLSGCCVGGIYVYLFPLRLETMFCLEPTSSSCTLLSTGSGPTTGEAGVQCRRPLIADIRWKQKAMICWCLSVGLSQYLMKHDTAFKTDSSYSLIFFVLLHRLVYNNITPYLPINTGRKTLEQFVYVLMWLLLRCCCCCIY